MPIGRKSRRTCQQLMMTTPQTIRDRTVNARITVYRDFLQKGSGWQHRLIYSSVALNNKRSSGKKYSCVIRNQADDGVVGTKQWLLRPTSKLWVHCSCPYFKYHLEVALHVRGASSFDEKGISTSNGDRPVEKNPKLSTYVCKHLYAVIKQLLYSDSKKYSYVQRQSIIPKREMR